MGILAFLARRFIAGEGLDDAVAAIRQLNALNISATVDNLGENVKTKEEATRSADAYLDILDAIGTHKLDANVSVKLTMMGMEIDPDFCYENAGRIVNKAKDMGVFVRIDMEGSPVTQLTLDLMRRFRKDYDQVGIVIQAMLRRSEEDIRLLAEEGVNVRLCKGAYKEPDSIAFPKKEDVNENYIKLAKLLIDGQGKVCLATHDRKMIEPIKAYIEEAKLPKERYEWQMLYGIERDLQKELANQGHNVRVYVPYGSDWLGYYTRRMMERKENFLFAMKHFFGG